MKDTELRFPIAGESKLRGYAGQMIEFTISNQLTDGETWKLFVDQFRLHSDDDNDWRGEYWGKMLRGAALTYRATKNERVYAAMRETVLDMISAQEQNGRLSSYPLEKEFDGWDMWGRKYVMLGMLYFLDVCKSKALAAKVTSSLRRQANYIVRRVGGKKGQKSIFDTSRNYGGLNSCSILEPFVKLYARTGDQKYLDFSTYIVESGFCKDMNLIELCLSKRLYPYQFTHTKAYEMMSCFEGLLEYYKLTGDETHLQAVENFVEMVVESDYTIIGCSGCTHELFDRSSIAQTEPAPKEVMQETCVTVTFMKLCAKLLAITGKAKYAGLIERSGLNALYGAVNNENQTMQRAEARKWIGDDLLYLPHESYPFDSYSPLFQDRRGKRVGGFKELQNGRSYGCCACIGSAGTAIMGLFAVMKGSDGVYVNLYNDCNFTTDDFGEPIKIAIFANPYKGGAAKLSVDGKGQVFALKLRVPEWTDGMQVWIDGENYQGVIENGYLTICRPWGKAKLVVRLKTPVKVTELGGKVAFTCGPIVLARDCRLGDISAPVRISARNGKSVRAKRVKNAVFASNVAYEIKTKDGIVTVCDYAQAGKNYDDEKSGVTVWQVRV